MVFVETIIFIFIFFKDDSFGKGDDCDGFHLFLFFHNNLPLGAFPCKEKLKHERMEVKTYKLLVHSKSQIKIQNESIKI